jgi:regulator of protease activity HflC (stomatin/prohibitin superfamily)
LIQDNIALSEEEREFIIAATLGDNIERACTDQTSPLAHLLARSRGEYSAAVLALIDTDLHDAKGISEATRLQAQARRYQDMCHWINDALEAAGQADEILADDVDGEAVEQLKEQMNGKRDKPAPDA